MDDELVIRPACAAWVDLARAPGAAADTSPRLLGHAPRDWRDKTRRELGLAADRPVIATGHQTLLWHPGILVKYMLADAIARTHGLARANLIVDQHASGGRGVGDFGGYDVPVRRPDGSLAVRRIELTRPRPDVPMALHAPFTPPAPPAPARLAPAHPAVGLGVERIHQAITAHRTAPDAARQMGLALGDLMAPWVPPAPDITASELLETSLGREILRAMAADPAECARAYNAAVAAHGDAGIGPLLVRDDYVELPLWRIRPDGRRMRAYDNDVAAWLDDAEAPRLMPRALLLTALVRLGMCDLFVHGIGGGRYDVAMEAWVEAWLGVTPEPIAVASATLHLPLAPADADPIDVERAIAGARRAWHDPETPIGSADARPESGPDPGPGPVKHELLEAINRTPYGSRERRRAFVSMHEQLATLRSVHVGRVEREQRRVAEARRRRADAVIATRRDWPFALYPSEQIDALAARVAAAVATPCAAGE